MTYTVTTPRGRHFYFTVGPEDPGRSTVGRLAPGVDTRAVGGFVVAAGSLVSRSGSRIRYRVDTPSGVAAPAPQDLLRRLDPGPTSIPPGAEALSGIEHPDRYVAAAVRAECARVARAAVGTRNDTIFRAAVALGRLAGRGMIEGDEVVRTLWAAASGHVGTHGLTGSEVARTIANGLRHSDR